MVVTGGVEMKTGVRVSCGDREIKEARKKFTKFKIGDRCSADTEVPFRVCTFFVYSAKYVFSQSLMLCPNLTRKAAKFLSRMIFSDFFIKNPKNFKVLHNSENVDSIIFTFLIFLIFLNISIF